MLFNKKNKSQKKCENCGKQASQSYNFCPNCGNNFTDLKREQEDFGLIGKNDFGDSAMPMGFQNFGISDKLVNSIFNSMMKNLDKQFKHVEKDLEKTEVKSLPNGIKIKISGPFNSQQEPKKEVKKKAGQDIDQQQMKKMNTFPREKAKTNVKRLGDKVIYELSTPGVQSNNDIFVSKLESGYEIKAIGSKKIYVNTLPISLPLRRYSVAKNKLLVEFKSQQD